MPPSAAGSITVFARRAPATTRAAEALGFPLLALALLLTGCGEGELNAFTDPAEDTALDAEVRRPKVCGDGKCNGGESCSSCALDCGVCVPPPSDAGDTDGGSAGGTGGTSGTGGGISGTGGGTGGTGGGTSGTGGGSGGGTGDYLIIARSALLALPTTGAAWTSLKAAADTSATPNLCDQDNKADVKALAAGLVYARTGDVTYRAKVIDLITRAMPTQIDGCYNAVLALGRQLGGYVMAADLAGYRDPAFLAWLRQLLTREIGGHGRWHQLRYTSEDSASNWGTFASASIVAADRFLGDATMVARDWARFSGYTDGSWAFRTTASYQAAWNCGSYVAIEYRSCATPGGLSQSGAPVEDASRNVYPVPHSGYVSEAMQGYTVQAILFHRAGYNAFGIGNSAIKRIAEFQLRFGIANPSSPGNYTNHVVNHFYGTSFPEVTPTSGGRIFGFADWLYP